MNTDILKLLGQQLKALRKENYPKDSQDSFALRIKVSKNTYQSMESGTGKVSFNSYLNVISLYGLEANMLEVFTKDRSDDLFIDMDVDR
jgi:DNA-binding XRE family transcriptional regulator